jgi:hypothetical protein
MAPIRFLTALVGILCFADTPAHADWVNLSGAENALNIAEIHIQDDHIQVDLEIFVENLATFDRLIPEDFFKATGIERSPLAERLRQFSEEDFQIMANGKEKLLATLQLAEPRMRKERPSPYAGKINPYTRQIIPGPPEDKRVLYVELVYPFQKRPQTLTFIPPLDEKGYAKAVIGFITYHNRVPLNEYRFLSEASRVNLDWEDPWYSAFENKALKRWQRGGVMSFLYIEPFEVRHEVLVRVKELEAWMELGLQGDEFIEPEENEPLKKQVGEFFLAREKVLIDGQSLPPILDRTAFVKYAITGSTFLEQPERLPINTAMIGVIITYFTKEIPKTVRSRVNGPFGRTEFAKCRPTRQIRPAPCPPRSHPRIMCKPG